MSEAEGAVKVEEWQQMFYALDSGIQSGATTIREEDESECGKKYSESATGNVLSKGLHSPLRNIWMNYTSNLTLESVALNPSARAVAFTGLVQHAEGVLCLFWDSAFLDIKRQYEDMN